MPQGINHLAALGCPFLMDVGFHDVPQQHVIEKAIRVLMNAPNKVCKFDGSLIQDVVAVVTHVVCIMIIIIRIIIIATTKKIIKDIHILFAAAFTVIRSTSSSSLAFVITSMVTSKQLLSLVLLVLLAGSLVLLITVTGAKPMRGKDVFIKPLSGSGACAR
jgi:hypothetical protein